MNYVAVLLCAVAAMIIGSIWYGPLFGTFQRESMGEATMSPEQKENMKKAMWGMFALQFILSFITAAMLQYFIKTCHIENHSPVIIAVAAWFGFIMPTVGGAALWSGKPKSIAWKMFFISISSQLITFVVYGLILGLWM